MIADFNEFFYDKGENVILGYHIISLGKDSQHWDKEK